MWWLQEMKDNFISAVLGDVQAICEYGATTIL